MPDDFVTRVLVVDPLALHRDAVAALLNGFTAMTAIPCGAARADIEQAVAAHQPAVVVLGLDALDDAAAGTLAVVREHHARVVLLTGTRDAAVHARAIELGVLGVVSRHHGGPVLCEAVRTVARGEIWLERQCAPAVVGCLVRRQGARDLETVKVESLTRREREIIALVTEGLRNKQIAARLCISEATVRNHLTSILSKLELTDRFDLAVYAFRRGMAKAALADLPAPPARAHAHSAPR